MFLHSGSSLTAGQNLCGHCETFRDLRGQTLHKESSSFWLISINSCSSKGKLQHPQHPLLSHSTLEVVRLIRTSKQPSGRRRDGGSHRITDRSSTSGKQIRAKYSWQLYEKLFAFLFGWKLQRVCVCVCKSWAPSELTHNIQSYISVSPENFICPVEFITTSCCSDLTDWTQPLLVCSTVTTCWLNVTMLDHTSF